MRSDISVAELRELIRLLVRHLGLLEKSEASCCGISLAQCHAIIEIGRACEISLNELAEILGLDNSTMSRTVNNLVEKDFVIRETDANDRRYVKIKLTEKGYEIYSSIESNMDNYYKDVMDSIPEEKRDQVIESLRLLDNAIKGKKCC